MWAAYLNFGTGAVRPIPGCPGYAASRDGRVFSLARRRPGRPGRTLAVRGREPQTTDNGKIVAVRINRADGRRWTLGVGPAVLRAFVGAPPTGMECCHGDGDRTNSALANLRWDTHRANIADRDRHGRTARGDRHGSRTKPERVPRGDRNGARRNPELLPRGERHGMAKLTASAVREIRRRRAAGETWRALGAAFGVSKSTARRAGTGKCWRADELAAAVAAGGADNQG